MMPSKKLLKTKNIFSTLASYSGLQNWNFFPVSQSVVFSCFEKLLMQIALNPSFETSLSITETYVTSVETEKLVPVIVVLNKLDSENTVTISLYPFPHQKG